MKIYEQKLSDITRYIKSKEAIELKEMKENFNFCLKHIQKFKAIKPDTRILDIGPGIGWFQILCKTKGISCQGLDINPQLIEYAKCFGKRYGVDLDIMLGNIEEEDIGVSKYDIIFAMSVFEHVEHWQKGIKHAYDALKPGGLLYFQSTNKFSFSSGECIFPFYGWLPNRWRYRLRIFRQGEDIMKLGIDFNQFTYCSLRAFFKKMGFLKVLDLVELRDSGNLFKPKAWKKIVLGACKRIKPLKHLVLCFAPTTDFICIK